MARVRSFVQIATSSPYGEAFTRSIASAAVRKDSAAMTGPKTSSRAMRMSGVTWSYRVGAT